MDAETPRDPTAQAEPEAREPERPGPAAEPEADAEALSDTGEAIEESPAAAEGADAGAQRFKDQWLRAEAELQNFRRRAARDLEESRRFTEEQGFLETIAQLDDLERAVEAARQAAVPEGWVQGVQLVAQRMRDYLARNGVTVVEARGQVFDPAFHEALLEVDAPPGVEPGHVVDVERRGYVRAGRVLRAARVVVARRSAG